MTKLLPTTCAVSDCSGEVKARHLCPRHYMRFMRHGTTEGKSRRSVTKQCEIPQCQRESRSRHMCRMHYKRWAAQQRTNWPKTNPPTLTERFWSKVEKTNGCWWWTGAGARYGVFTLPNGGTVSAHRMSWMLAGNDIPPGLYVLHHCDHAACVRPDHLWTGTALDNTHDMIRKGRARFGGNR